MSHVIYFLMLTDAFSLLSLHIMSRRVMRNNAMTHEIDALEINHTWDITDLPPGNRQLVVDGYIK